MRDKWDTTAAGPPQHSPLFKELQAEIIDEGLNFVGRLRGDILRDSLEGAVSALTKSNGFW